MISGKPKEQCALALKAAFGNPDRAFEYLMAGVPLSEGAVGQEEVGDDYGDEEEGSEPMGGNPFAALAANPNF